MPQALATPQPGVDFAWMLESLPPDYWIPMVPVPLANNGGFTPRKGSFDEQDSSLGRILAPTPYNLFDEEVPREGMRCPPSAPMEQFSVIA